jgi:S1-C subfamily serine protease
LDRQLAPALVAPVLVLLALAGPVLAGPSSSTPAPLAVAATPAVSTASSRSRAQVARAVLPTTVRVQLLAHGEVKRTATGVVVKADPATEHAPARSAVLTNAHVADPEGLAEPTWRVLVERRGRVERTLPARLLGLGRVPDNDLALLEVDETLPGAAELAPEAAIDVGDEVVVVGAPYGRALSVSGGMLSQVEAEEAEPAAPLRFKAMKTDAAIGYGSSGGGVYSVPGGQLVGIVEGYRTARVALNERQGFDVPMPGETFIAPVTKVRAFLSEHLGPTATARLSAGAR